MGASRQRAIAQLLIQDIQGEMPLATKEEGDLCKCCCTLMRNHLLGRSSCEKDLGIEAGVEVLGVDQAG
jgi:hypothetical protein